MAIRRVEPGGKSGLRPKISRSPMGGVVGVIASLTSFCRAVAAAPVFFHLLVSSPRR
ncbi:hypothetical protein KJ567_06815 [Candidatus Bipolaricaulota bacterium]|nr:hypothetical protein [Candidatus Bipolaricaulota bacterium]